MEETQTTDNGDTVVSETLDDVISEYNVQPPAQESSQAQVQPEITPVAKVDPLDENQFQNYTNQVAQNQTALNSQVRELSEKLTHFEQKEAELRIETDINSAVKQLNDGLDLDPKLVRVHLELTAQEKPGFKKVWENRHNDPKTYNRALAAIQKEIGNTYAVRQDSELTETQAAIRQSQQTLASNSGAKQKNSLEETLANAKGSDFDNAWQRALGH